MEKIMSQGIGQDIQSVISPLYFFDNVETAVNDELVHVPGLRAKSGNAVSTSLGSAKFMFEERIVSRADYCKVVRHCDSRDLCEKGRLFGVLIADQGAAELPNEEAVRATPVWWSSWSRE